MEPKGEYVGIEVEAVCHEVGKYLRLLCRNNGYILEQIFSPLVVAGADFLYRLKSLATKCATRNCHHHYRGFLQTQRTLLDKEVTIRAKTLLYAFRAAMTGVHLLETGEVEANLPILNERFRLPYIEDLIARKAAAEMGSLPGLDWVFYRSELDRWERRLDEAFTSCQLPTEPPKEELHRFLVDLRLGVRDH